MSLKKINKITLYILFFFNALYAYPSLTKDLGIQQEALSKYLKNFNEFSASFIQSNNETTETGLLFIKKNRIKIQYQTPSNILIVLSENKAMYFNQDLEEVEYFNPDKSIAGIFFNIFNNENFFSNVPYKEEDKSLVFQKLIQSSDGTNIKLNIYFEKNPLVLRKIKLLSNDVDIIYSIFDHNFFPSLKEEDFSMANPLL